MTEHENLGKLFEALAAAQAEMGRLVTDDKADTGKYGYTYATLANVLNTARPVIGKHGLALVQYVEGSDLVSVLGHSSGVSITARWPLPKSSTAQAAGSAVTYWRRYQAMALLGLAPEDDDGAAATHDARRDRDTKPAKKPNGRPRPTPPDSKGAKEWLSAFGLTPDDVEKAWDGIPFEDALRHKDWARFRAEVEAGRVTADTIWGATPREAANK